MMTYAVDFLFAIVPASCTNGPFVVSGIGSCPLTQAQTLPPAFRGVDGTAPNLRSDLHRRGWSVFPQPGKAQFNTVLLTTVVQVHSMALPFTL
ncbi:hypothetical protein GE09DRAFT_556469 [Coniochaeta sp. 2T2.1]|nr:hypothetical protein GE09DRAFT_556469 [Coniochaeta sp. 2T2.1]